VNLSDVLKKIADDTSGDKITIKDVVEKLESRGYGPLLIAPALLAILPTGAVPGIPSICGLTIVLIAVQLVFNKSHPWLPKKLQDIEMDRDKFTAALDKAIPYTEKIDKLFKPRIEALTGPIGKRVVSLICGISALLMIPLEVVPFAAAIPASAVVFMGLGLSTKDGVMSIVGVVLSLVSFWFVYSTVI